ncbi:MAG: hypothetical protein J5I93_21330, partial [Pirellulaceae bacterium]|nr:hypothetical protein [Pirellulaceae bacterium]
MFQGWRIRLREAETALDQGRLEEAGRMLAEGDLQKFLPGRLLSGKVAQRLAERARQRMLQGDFAAGWRDLQHSRQVGGESQDFLVARQELTELVLGEAEGHLRAGDAARALGVLAELDRDEPQCESWRLLRDVCRHVESARNLCRRGKFLEADAQLQAAAALRPDLPVLSARRAEYRQLHDRSRDIYQRLHQALAAASWSEALAAADRLL